jgi:hypothetical protein
MPRGEHFKKDVDEAEILDQFDRDDIDREMYTTAEISENIDRLTSDAIRQRMQRMESVESEKLGNTRFWHRKGVDPFADGGQHSNPLFESRAEALRSVFGSEASGERRLKVIRDFLADGVTLSLYALAPAVLVETFGPIQGVAAPLAIVAVGLAAVWVLALVLSPDDSVRGHLRHRLGRARDTRDDLLGGEPGDE